MLKKRLATLTPFLHHGFCGFVLSIEKVEMHQFLIIEFKAPSYSSFLDSLQKTAVILFLRPSFPFQALRQSCPHLSSLIRPEFRLRLCALGEHGLHCSCGRGGWQSRRAGCLHLLFFEPRGKPHFSRSINNSNVKALSQS